MYLSLQRTFARTISVDAYTGPHDVQKQNRLEQLKKAKSLADYHPRLEHNTGVERVSVREFNARYEKIKDTQSDVVSVFGTMEGNVDTERG